MWIWVNHIDRKQKGRVNTMLVRATVIYFFYLFIYLFTYYAILKIFQLYDGSKPDSAHWKPTTIRRLRADLPTYDRIEKKKPAWAAQQTVLLKDFWVVALL